MPKITLPQKNITIDVESGCNLMDTLMKAGVPVASSCQGEGVCSMCRLKVITGTVKPAQQHEIETLKRNKCEPDERLSCQIHVDSDLVVTTKYW